MRYLTPNDLQGEFGNAFIFDVECFSNFFFAAFKSLKTGSLIVFERSPDSELNGPLLRWFIETFEIIGFNCKNYDDILLWAAIDGIWTEQLKGISDAIIFSEMKPSEIEASYGFRCGVANSIDLIEVAPSAGLSSLKQYGGRMHTQRMQDLPFDPNKELTRDEAAKVREYCINDLAQTEELYRKLEKAIELRKRIGEQYGLDLRSKSDAQIAEAVIKKEISELTGKIPTKPTVTKSSIFSYQVPDFIQFYTEELQEILAKIRAAEFKIDENGKLIMPPEFAETQVKIGKSKYQLGIGGLHSCEKAMILIADEEMVIIDRDVESYYPAIILREKLFPEHIGPAFLDTYGDIVRRRLQAKRDKDKTTADSLKITINGAFGKLGSKYSAIYAPNLLIQVTITGQLSLLMLIEMLEWCGISVRSANTDGIVIYCPHWQIEQAQTIVAQWEQITGFRTEESSYKAYYARDVNNYIAIGRDDSIKAKGEFVNLLSMKEPNREMLMKNPDANICSEAVMLFLRDEIPIETTIRNSREFSKFVIVRKVKGGAEKDREYIGKVIRWYMRTNDFRPIRYVSNGAMVPESCGGCPVMEMPSKFPKDIDYTWYIQRTKKMLSDMGYGNKFKQMELFV